VQSEEIETPDGGSGDADVSAQIVSELGEARATVEEGSEGPGEVIDILESARCVIHGVVAECMYDSSEDETLMHDKYVSPRSRFGQVRCDSTAEISLRNKYNVLQPEEVVSTSDEEEIVDPITVKGLTAKQPLKKGIRKPVSVEKDIEEIVRELDEEAPMTASMAFMRACLASPAGVKLSKVPVPSNYREARCNGRKLPGPEMCRILGRKLPGPEMKVLESGTRLGDEGSPGTDRLVTDSAECSNLTGVSSLSLFLCHHKVVSATPCRRFSSWVFSLPVHAAHLLCVWPTWPQTVRVPYDSPVLARICAGTPSPSTSRRSPKFWSRQCTEWAWILSWAWTLWLV
jgi:hypothetical protein